MNRTTSYDDMTQVGLGWAARAVYKRERVLYCTSAGDLRCPVCVVNYGLRNTHLTDVLIRTEDMYIMYILSFSLSSLRLHTLLKVYNRYTFK